MDNDKLLKALNKIKISADKEGVDFWALGGLAHAFHAGKLYRDFGDLDLIVKTLEDYNKFLEILKNLGYKKIKE